MLEIKLRIPKELAKKLKDHERIEKKHLAQGLDASGLYIAGLAQELSPIQTSRLRKSIGFRRENMIVKVGSNVKYARIMEFGGVIEAKNARTISYTLSGDAYFKGSDGRLVHLAKGRTITYSRKTLTFKIGNRWISKKKVTIKGREYLRGAIKQGMPEVVRIMRRAQENALKEVGFDT